MSGLVSNTSVTISDAMFLSHMDGIAQERGRIVEDLKSVLRKRKEAAGNGPFSPTMSIEEFIEIVYGKFGNK